MPWLFYITKKLDADAYYENYRGSLYIISSSK